MQIIVNGEPKECSDQLSLADALIHWGYSLDMPMAVAINHAVIHKGAFATHQLNAKDVLEILMPMQGG